MDASIVVAGIAAGAATLGAWFTYRTSAQANRISDRKVDSEVFERTQSLYDKALDGAERELMRLQQSHERLTQQLERINNQLEQEQLTSFQLRGQIRMLEAQVNTMTGIIESLRNQLSVVPGRPPVP